jgi:hypothetical protein
MKKILLLFALFQLLSFQQVNSQSTINLPIQGSYRVSVNSSKANFDIVKIVGNKFYLIANQQEVDAYVVIAETNSDYTVEQYIPGQENIKKDRKRLTVKILESTGNTVKIRIIKGSTVQDLELLKN